jgi:hypothetical protein
MQFDDKRNILRITAAADISLTALHFEPCGLTTLNAMRYGTLRISCPSLSGCAAPILALRFLLDHFFKIPISRFDASQHSIRSARQTASSGG